MNEVFVILCEMGNDKHQVAGEGYRDFEDAVQFIKKRSDYLYKMSATSYAGKNCTYTIVPVIVN